MPEPSADPVTAPEGDAMIAACVQPLVLEAATARAVAVEKSATKKLGVVGWIAIVWIVATFGSALLAPWLPIAEPDETFIRNIGDGPSLGHPFGIDGIGQDMFARVIWGARASLLVSV